MAKSRVLGAEKYTLPTECRRGEYFGTTIKSTSYCQFLLLYWSLKTIFVKMKFSSAGVSEWLWWSVFLLAQTEHVGWARNTFLLYFKMYTFCCIKLLRFGDYLLLQHNVVYPATLLKIFSFHFIFQLLLRPRQREDYRSHGSLW